MSSPADSVKQRVTRDKTWSMTWRRLVFAVLALTFLGVATLYVVRARISASPGDGPKEVSLHTVSSNTLLFVNKQLDAFGTVAANQPGSSERTVSKLRCDRLHFANDQGVCLVADRGVFTTYWVAFFGKNLKPNKKVPLPGIPSRVRVAPNGQIAATTVFVSGHSYAPGKFSTETSLWRLDDGSRIATLEQF